MTLQTTAYWLNDISANLLNVSHTFVTTLAAFIAGIVATIVVSDLITKQQQSYRWRFEQLEADLQAVTDWITHLENRLETSPIQAEFPKRSHYAQVGQLKQDESHFVHEAKPKKYRDRD